MLAVTIHIEMSVKCRKWILKSHFKGSPKREDLEIVEEELPPLKDGGRYLTFGFEAEYLG